MPFRKEKRRYPVTASPAPSTPPPGKFYPTLSVWWLTGTRIDSDWHLGHQRAMDDGEANESKSKRAVLSEKMTAVQTCIAEFLIASGQPMHIDMIVRHVGRKWTTLRKEDNLPQTTRLKVAVEQALSSPEMQAGLFFKQVEGADLADYWCLVDDDVQENDSDSDNDDDEAAPEASQTSAPVQSFAKQLAAADDDISELVALMIEALVSHGGKAHIDQICSHVANFWGTLRQKDGSYYANDCRRTVTAALNSSIGTDSYFKRDEDSYHFWHITEHARPALQKVRAPINGVKFVKCEMVRRPTMSRIETLNADENGDGESTVQDDSSSQVADDEPNSPSISLSSRDQEIAITLGLSDLQVVLIYVLGRHGADTWVNMDDVYAGVKPYWGTLRRRDGTEYNSDLRRAVAASLSNNPSVPIFKREGKDKSTWMLTKGGRDKLAMLRGECEVVADAEVSGKRSSPGESDDDAQSSSAKRRKK